MVRLRRREITPSVGVSIPARSLNSVDLPPPFSPTRPMRSPSMISKSISRKIGLPPKSLLTLEKLMSNMVYLLGQLALAAHNKQGRDKSLITYAKHWREC